MPFGTAWVSALILCIFQMNMVPPLPLTRLLWSNEAMHVKVLGQQKVVCRCGAAGSPPVPSVGLAPWPLVHPDHCSTSLWAASREQLLSKWSGHHTLVGTWNQLFDLPRLLVLSFSSWASYLFRLKAKYFQQTSFEQSHQKFKPRKTLWTLL